MKPLHIFLILGALFFFLFIFRNDVKLLLFPPKTEKIEVGGKVLEVEVAETPEKRMKGLSGRTFLPKNGGMLFIFEEERRHTFWMKGMKFPLDFVWIRGSKVVDLSENITPKEWPPPKTLAPKEPVDKVLELKAGAVERLGIEIGEEVKF